VFGAAVDDGLIATNPCRAGSVKLPKRQVRTIEPWPLEQVEAVIDVLPSRYRALGVVAAGCGLRQGEALGLRVRDIDFLRRRVHVEQQVKIVRSQLVIDRPKGGKTRFVPLPDTVATALAAAIASWVPQGQLQPATGGTQLGRPLNLCRNGSVDSAETVG
jgi:integrase